MAEAQDNDELWYGPDLKSLPDCFCIRGNPYTVKPEACTPDGVPYIAPVFVLPCCFTETIQALARVQELSRLLRVSHLPGKACW